MSMACAAPFPFITARIEKLESIVLNFMGGVVIPVPRAVFRRLPRLIPRAPKSETGRLISRVTGLPLEDESIEGARAQGATSWRPTTRGANDYCDQGKPWQASLTPSQAEGESFTRLSPAALLRGLRQVSQSGGKRIKGVTIYGGSRPNPPVGPCPTQMTAPTT